MESHNFFWSTLIVLAVVLVIAFSMHWLDFSSTKNPETGKVEVALSIDNEKFKSDAVIAKEKVAEKAGELKQALTPKDKSQVESEDWGGPAQGQDVRLILPPLSYQLVQGTKTEVTVSRVGGDMGVLQIGLRPSEGSNLVASGGVFKKDETETTFTIEAPHNAHDGTISVFAAGKVQSVTVSVIP